MVEQEQEQEQENERQVGLSGGQREKRVGKFGRILHRS